MIQHLLINAAFIIGLYMISQQGYILYKYRELCERIPVLHKPLITCQLCMSSVYGILYMAFVIHPAVDDLTKAPFYLISLAFTVALLKTIIEVLLAARDYLQQKTLPNND